MIYILLNCICTIYVPTLAQKNSLVALLSSSSCQLDYLPIIRTRSSEDKIIPGQIPPGHYLPAGTNPQGKFFPRDKILLGQNSPMTKSLGK